MSFQWVSVSLQNTKKIATNAYPLIVSLSPITGNDASFIRVSAEVGSFAGAGTAAMEIQQSHDNGKTWISVLGLGGGSITGTGTFIVETTPGSGILSPSIRLVITPQAGVSLSLTELRKTFSPGPVIPTSSTGGASEATLTDVLTSVDGIEGQLTTLLGSTGNIEADVGLIQGNVATITTSTGNIEADTSAILAAVQSTEALVSSIETSTNNIEADVDAIRVSSQAMETDVDAIRVAVQSMEAKSTQVGFFSLPYDQMVPDYSGLTTDVYRTYKAAVLQQTLTVTYSDATKSVMTNLQVV